MTPITENFREEMRYEFSDLKPDELIIDCGGYEGRWTSEMIRRYDCWAVVFEPIFWAKCYENLKHLEPKARIIPVGVGGKNEMVRFGIKGDMTGVFCGDEGDFFPSIDFTEWFARLNTPISVLKLNIEASEYVLIDRLIHSGQIKRIKNLQVQFHNLQDWCKEYYERLAKQLSETHELTYFFPYIWENWRRKE